MINIRNERNIRDALKYQRIHGYEKDIIYDCYKWINSNVKTGWYIFFMEPGDSLYDVEIIGLYMKRGGIIGTEPIRIYEVEDFIVYHYRHNGMYMCMILPRGICSVEVINFFKIYKDICNT